MKKVSGKVSDDMRPEYKRSDLGTLVRGKYAQRYRESTNVVVLEPEIAKAFPNARAVNTALRERKTKRRVEAAASGATCEATNIVMLDPDVFADFPNSAAVNKALRAILDAAPARRSKRRRP